MSAKQGEILVMLNMGQKSVVKSELELDRRTEMIHRDFAEKEFGITSHVCTVIFHKTPSCVYQIAPAPMSEEIGSWIWWDKMEGIFICKVSCVL